MQMTKRYVQNDRLRVGSRSTNKYKCSDFQCQRQTGIVLIVTLMAMVIMLLASVALIRSTDANLLIAGNMAFKRDLINQGERAIPQIKTLFDTGALKTSSSRNADDPNSNYYATIQPSNKSGVPNVLFTVSGSHDITPTDSSGVVIRYVIDRMCLSSGVVDVSRCTVAGSTTDLNAGSSNNGQKTSGIDYPVYRITLRVTGPRNTVAYLQTTYSN